MLETLAQIQNEERRRNDEAQLRNSVIRANDAAATGIYLDMMATGVDMMTRGR